MADSHMHENVTPLSYVVEPSMPTFAPQRGTWTGDRLEVHAFADARCTSAPSPQHIPKLRDPMPSPSERIFGSMRSQLRGWCAVQRD
jgi:hypothetical protein